MSKEEYASTQERLVLLAQIVAELDLAGFLNAISVAETVGPFFDPTLYLQAGGKLQKVRELASSLQPFHREATKQMSKAGAA